jgi:peptide/nickel transport system substrate-binding protein
MGGEDRIIGGQLRDRIETAAQITASNVTRRAALEMLVAGMGAAIFAACASPVQPASTVASTGTSNPSAGVATTTPIPASTTVAATAASTSAPPTNPTSQPKTGGTLRSATVGDPTSLDGHVYSNGGVYETTWLVYDRLTQYDSTLHPQPMLAESWDVSSDYTQIKLNLRKGVQFHNGREFTSDDVKYNLVRSLDPKAALGLFVTQAKWFTSIDTPDKYTVILKSDKPRPLVFDFFEVFNIVDKETVEGPNPKTTEMGTGPFAFVEWAQGDHISFTKNKNYWLSNRPYLDGVRASIVADQQTMTTQLEAAALDVINKPALADLSRLKSDPGFQAIVHPNSGFFYGMGYNVTKPPFDNKVVRQALNYAIDRQRFVDTALFGLGKAEDLFWAPGSPAYDAGKQNVYAYDLDKAKSLLAQAGVGNFDMEIVFQAAADGNTLAQIWQEDLAKLGVTLAIRNLQSAAFLDQVFNLSYNGVYWAAGTWGNFAPATLLGTSRGWNPAGNNSGYTNDDYASLIATASSETDPAKQKAVYQQLNDLFLDQSFYMVVSTFPPTMLARANAHGIEPNYHGSFGYTQTWLD